MAEQQGTSQDRHFKMVFLRSDDLREVKSFDLSLAGIYILVSSIFILIGGLTWLAISHTPLRQLIPGYAKIEANEQFVQLVESVDALEKSIDERQTYMNAFKKIVTSGVPEEKEIEGGNGVQGESVPITAQSDVVIPQVTRNELTSNQAQNNDIIGVLSTTRHYVPVNGIISSAYNPAIKHYGVDFLAPANTPIKVMMEGYVISAGWDIETGYTIGVQHKGNILSFYKHNSQLLKEKGTFVSAGEAIAIIGNTGTLSTGPHLHFELWHNGTSVNPADYLNLK